MNSLSLCHFGFFFLSFNIGTYYLERARERRRDKLKKRKMPVEKIRKKALKLFKAESEEAIVVFLDMKN